MYSFYLKMWSKVFYQAYLESDESFRATLNSYKITSFMIYNWFILKVHGIFFMINYISTSTLYSFHHLVFWNVFIAKWVLSIHFGISEIEIFSIHLGVLDSVMDKILAYTSLDSQGPDVCKLMIGLS